VLSGIRVIPPPSLQVFPSCLLLLVASVSVATPFVAFVLSFQEMGDIVCLQAVACTCCLLPCQPDLPSDCSLVIATGCVCVMSDLCVSAGPLPSSASVSASTNCWPCVCHTVCNTRLMLMAYSGTVLCVLHVRILHPSGCWSPNNFKYALSKGVLMLMQKRRLERASWI